LPQEIAIYLAVLGQRRPLFYLNLNLNRFPTPKAIPSRQLLCKAEHPRKPPEQPLFNRSFVRPNTLRTTRATIEIAPLQGRIPYEPPEQPSKSLLCKAEHPRKPPEQPPFNRSFTRSKTLCKPPEQPPVRKRRFFTFESLSSTSPYLSLPLLRIPPLRTFEPLFTSFLRTLEPP